MHFIVFANSLKKVSFYVSTWKILIETFLSHFQTLCINKTGAEDQMHYVQNQQLSLKNHQQIISQNKNLAKWHLKHVF